MGTEKSPVSAFSGAPDNGVSASDRVRAPRGLVLRQVNSTLASVAPRQSWGLSGRCPAETASEDPAHRLSLGFRRQHQTSRDLHLTDAEQHTGAGGSSLDSTTWEPDFLGPRAGEHLTLDIKAGDCPSVMPGLPPTATAPQTLSSSELSESPQNRSPVFEYSPLPVDGSQYLL